MEFSVFELAKILDQTFKTINKKLNPGATLGLEALIQGKHKCIAASILAFSSALIALSI